jgi:gamma-glutamylcysteine synthetase
MVDVQLYDREKDIYYIEAGFGEKADWYSNIQHHPAFDAQVGRRKFAASATRLPVERAVEITMEYARQHALYTWLVLHLVGADPAVQLRQLAEQGIFLAVQPITEKTPPGA